MQLESDRAVTEPRLSGGKGRFRICGLSRWWLFPEMGSSGGGASVTGKIMHCLGLFEFEVPEGGPRRASGGQGRDWAGDAELRAKNGVPTAAEAEGWLYLPRKSVRQVEGRTYHM